MREEKVINLWEVIPEDEHSHISNKIWEALDRAGIDLSQDAELSIKVYDEINDEKTTCLIWNKCKIMLKYILHQLDLGKLIH